MAKPGEKGSGQAVQKSKDGTVKIIDRFSGKIIRETNKAGKQVIRVDAKPNPRGGSGKVFKKVDDPKTAANQDRLIQARQEERRREREAQKAEQERLSQRQAIADATKDINAKQFYEQYDVNLTGRGGFIVQTKESSPSAQPINTSSSRVARFEPDKRLSFSQIVEREGRGRKGDIAGLRAIEGRSLDRAMKIQSDIDAGEGNRILNELRLQGNVALRDISGGLASVFGTPEIIRDFSTGEAKFGSIGPALATEDTRFRSAPLDVLGIIVPAGLTRRASTVIDLPASTKARMGRSTPVRAGPDSIPLADGSLQTQLSPKDLRRSQVVFDPEIGVPTSLVFEKNKPSFDFAGVLQQRTLTGRKASDRFKDFQITVFQDPISQVRTTTSAGDINVFFDTAFGRRQTPKSTQTTFGSFSDRPILVATSDTPSGTNIRILNLEEIIRPPSVPKRSNSLFFPNKKGQSNILDSFSSSKDVFQDFFESTRVRKAVPDASPRGIPKGFVNPFIKTVPGRLVPSSSPFSILRNDGLQDFSLRDLTKANTSLASKTSPVLDSANRFAVRSITVNDLDSLSSLRLDTDQKTKTKTRVRSLSVITPPDTVTRNLLDTDKFLPPKNIPDIISRDTDSPRRPPRTPRIPISFDLPKIDFGGPRRSRTFRFTIGKPGNKFFSEFSSSDLVSGVRRARSKVDSTLAASFSVDGDERLSRDDKRLIDGLLGSNFARSKKGGSRFVERREKRLSTKTETLSIGSARKKLTSNKNFLKALGLVNKGVPLRKARRLL